ncbi:Thymidine phosphorylase [Aequoribacter fuscus]|jgi:hypothetical protein|uniref:Thymidine phosphorylase n=1 Tax=Aequoribacter fuscus TaxID=2518989 RepID=F3KZL5_9GAMM|nr:DUF1631 family protein [Aequoribacter fuscus]EGG30444.1 Thymidine phosphorylase [Aequoribacter fuscus]QHJ88191.1 DUF1631 family protein [Aequoribacter fuscus]
MSNTAPDNLEIPCLILSDHRQQRGALKFGKNINELLLAVPALPEPGDIPTPPAQVGETGQLFIPSAADTLCLNVEILATAIDHVSLVVLELNTTDELKLRERVRGAPDSHSDTSRARVLTPEEKRALLEKTNHYVLAQLQELFDNLFTALVADLQTASLNPKLLQAQQEIMFEGMRQVEIVKPRMLEILMRDLQRRLQGNPDLKANTHKKRIDQITQEELDLVDLKEFEESLAVKRLLRLGEDHHRGVFELMMIRYASLKGVKPKPNLLPLSLNLLIPSLKRALNQREIPNELSHRIFDFCGHLLLRKAKTVYANINLVLKQAGLEPDVERRLEAGAPLLPSQPNPSRPRPVKPKIERQPSGAQEHDLELSAVAATLPDNNLVTLQVDKDKAAFIERLMASMGDTEDPNEFSDNLVADMFAQVRSDANLNPTLGAAIESLQTPMQQIAREDPNFLINNQHPMRLAFDQLTQLARADLYPNPKLQTRVVDLIAQVGQNQALDSESAAELAEQTAAIRQQQERQFHRNIERLRQVEQGQVRYRDARLATLRELQDALPSTQTSASLCALVTKGWLELLTLNRLRSKDPASEASRLRANIGLFVTVLQARVTNANIEASQVTAATKLLGSIESEISETLPTRVSHVTHCAALRSEVCGQREIDMVNIFDTGLFKELSASNLRERLQSLPRLNRLVRRALAIPVDTWLSDAAQERRVYLAWHNPDQDQFVFANERGQKTLDTNLLGFARLLHRGQHPIRSIEELPILDRQLLQRLHEFTPRRLESTKYFGATNALSSDSFAKQVVVSSQQAMEQRQSMHLALFAANNIDLVAALYDKVIVEAYDNTLIDALTSHLADEQILGHFATAKIAVIFFGESDVSLRKRLKALTRSLNQLTVATGDEMLPLEVQWKTLQIDTALTGGDEATSTLNTLAAASAESALALSNLGRDGLTDNEHLRANFDHTAIALFAFHLHWTHYHSEVVERRIEFRLQDLETGEEIQSPYTTYRNELHPAIDRWRIQAVFAWLQSLAEQEREIPNCVIDIASTSLNELAFCDALLDDISEYGVGTNKLYFRVDLNNSLASVESLQEFTQILSDIGCRIIGSNVMNADPRCLTSATCDLLEVTVDDAGDTNEQQLRQLDSARLLGCPVVFLSPQGASSVPEFLRSSLSGEETLRSAVKPLSQITRELDTLKH